MNEQIKELALQAGGSHYPEVGGELLEKFAMLVIKECAKVVNDTEYPYENESDKDTWETCCVWSAEKLKEHFGIE